MVGLTVVLSLPQFEKLWLSRYSKDAYFHYFYLVLKFSLPVELLDSKAMYFESLSTPLNFAVKSSNLDIAICSLYFNFGVQ